MNTPNNHPHRLELFKAGNRNASNLNARQARKLNRFKEARVVVTNGRVEVVMRPQSN